MVNNIDKITESIETETDEFLDSVEQSILKEMIDEKVQIKVSPIGNVIYDQEELNMKYSVFTDDLIRNLDMMVLREEITEEELDYIKEKTGLN